MREVVRLPGTWSESFVRHTLISGKSGSGKSNAAEFMLTQNFKLGKNKCIDLYDDGRFENMCYGLPNSSIRQIRRMEELSSGMLKPMVFPNDIIMLCGQKLKFNHKFPKIVKVMSLSDKALTTADYFYMLGKTDAARSFISGIFNRFGEDLSLDDVHTLLTKNELNGRKMGFKIASTTRSVLLREVNRWRSCGLFSDRVERVNFQEILKDTGTITSFSSYLLDDQEKAIAYGLVLRNILHEKLMRSVKHRVLLYIRELSHFVNRDFFTVDEQRMAYNTLMRIIREGRDLQISLLSDMQRQTDCPSVLRRQQGYVVQMKTDFADAEKLLEVQFVPKHILQKIAGLRIGEAIIASGIRFDYPILFPPTQHQHKFPGLDVMDSLGKRYGWSEWNYKEIMHMTSKEVDGYVGEEEVKKKVRTIRSRLEGVEGIWQMHQSEKLTA